MEQLPHPKRQKRLDPLCVPAVQRQAAASHASCEARRGLFTACSHPTAPDITGLRGMSTDAAWSSGISDFLCRCNTTQRSSYHGLFDSLRFFCFINTIMCPLVEQHVGGAPLSIAAPQIFLASARGKRPPWTAILGGGETHAASKINGHRLRHLEHDSNC